MDHLLSHFKMQFLVHFTTAAKGRSVCGNQVSGVIVCHTFWYCFVCSCVYYCYHWLSYML